MESTETELVAKSLDTIYKEIVSSDTLIEVVDQLEKLSKLKFKNGVILLLKLY